MTTPPPSRGRRAVRTPVARALPLLALPLLAACGDSSGPPEPRPGIAVVSGGSGSDTVLTRRAERLVVEVRDSAGRPAGGVTVRFTASPDGGAPDQSRPYVTPCDAAQPTCVPTLAVEAVTDDVGRASVGLVHGHVAGAATLTVTVPELAYTSSASYTTLPGALARIAAPYDTAIYVGASFAPDVRAVDQFGNARGESVALAAMTPSVATVSEGRVTAVALGLARVELRAGALVDTILVGVPPQGRLAIAVWPEALAGNIEMALISTDGSARRHLADTPGFGGWTPAEWSWDGRRVLFSEGIDGPWVYAIDTATSARAAVVDTTVFSGHFRVSYPRSGGVMYFTGSGPEGYGLYRANLDGSALQRIHPEGTHPDVSPDGTRIAYIGYDYATGRTVIMVRDLATGQTTIVAESNYAPTWSSDGSYLSFLTFVEGPYGPQQDLVVVRPDGTGRRVLAESMFTGGSWSPDGEWIAAASGFGPVYLIRVADGVRIRVPGTGGFAEAVDWRP